MAFKWWKCRHCFSWNWTANHCFCPRCKFLDGDASLHMPETAKVGPHAQV